MLCCVVVLLFCAPLYCTALYCTALYCTAGYCRVLQFTAVSRDEKVCGDWHRPCSAMASPFVFPTLVFFLSFINLGRSERSAWRLPEPDWRNGTRGITRTERRRLNRTDAIKLTESAGGLGMTESDALNGPIRNWTDGIGRAGLH